MKNRFMKMCEHEDWVGFKLQFPIILEENSTKTFSKRDVIATKKQHFCTAFWH